VAKLKRISRRSWLLIGRWTLFGTLGCLGVSLAFAWLLFRGVEPAMMRRTLTLATVLPILLAAPLFAYLTMKIRELAIANDTLAALAATDSLTGCLNRGAFVTQIEDWLAGTGGRRASPVGALLIIDVDNFKSINDTFGHATGDEALQMIARSIDAASRNGDIVGRIGGEEYGVFLPVTTADHARDVAERIRHTIEAAPFAPGGRSHAVTVSVGCAAFDAPIAFRDLFKIADERLYRAKNGGRNQICTGPPASAPA